jgi:PAS domain S-box-containing protein
VKNKDGEIKDLLSTGHDVTESIQMTKLLKKKRVHSERLVEAHRTELMNSKEQLKKEIERRKRIEAALRRQRAEWENTFNAIGDWVSIIDLDYRIIRTNRAVKDILGVTQEEAIGLQCYKLVHGSDRRSQDCPLHKMLKTLKREMVEIQLADGRWLLVVADPLISGNGKLLGAVHIVRDITSRKRQEEDSQKLKDQLQQIRRREATANMAGGMAHQFNNALSVITGNIGLLKMAFPDDETVNGHLEQMMGSVNRMTRLTDQLLAYGRGGKYQSASISLSYFVKSTLSMLSHTLKPSIKLETDLPDYIFKIRGDLTQMQMVLSEILSNASEAIGEGGHIFVACSNEEIPEHKAAKSSVLKPGLYACLTVEDDGAGMNERTRRHIFEPFFTTKFQGRGLGMAAVYGIVKNHDGLISVGSELGKGTTVRIYLPAIDVEEKRSKMSKSKMHNGNGTILLIEDEEIVRDVSREILEKMGYRVLEAENGKRAIDIARTFYEDIDLAILDILLPDMGGEAIYPLLMEARPNLKVIVYSGYALDEKAKQILDLGAQGFIQKPFSIDTLSEALNGLLAIN